MLPAILSDELQLIDDFRGMGYDLEVEAVRIAHSMDMLTTPYAFNADESTRMAKAGADIVVAHMGLTTSGSIGAKSGKTLDDCVKEVQQIQEAALKVNPEVIVLCHGGPIAKPEDAKYILERCKGVHGFYGASSMERLPVEEAITGITKSFKNITASSSGSAVFRQTSNPFATSPRFARTFSALTMVQDPFKPARRVAGQRQDVWSIVNEAAGAYNQEHGAGSVVNMGQGFFGYNPPEFVLNAAKDALDKVECNQYSPTKGRPRLKKAIADAYSPFFGKQIDPETEVTITTGANEGMLSAFMGFLEPGDEVIVFEPFFDQYISNIEMPGGKVVYVPLHPPKDGATKTTSAGDWTLDMKELESKITDKTRMMVVNTPHNPVGKVFSREELQAIGDLCVKHNIIILSDEVYDRLYYVPFTRPSTLSPEIANLTLTVGSGGKCFYCTGWRVGYLIGPEHLIKYVSAAHTRICFSSVSPLQEATAVAFEQAEQHNFWEESKKSMKAKMDKFNEVWDELGLPYSDPEGGYFVLVNFAKVKLPEDYEFPPHVASRPRDFKLSWFFIKELGIAAIPPTEFFTDANAHIVEDWLRFAVCKDDEVLEKAKERLRGLKKYIQ
ncbi:hypothetical protein BTJ68_14690 [Hortaea werneckii EXF-2000]|uniref:Aminotransferase class I/classII domain-containing protein n=1 Tax=Hortaea werneckii EXF-2000 TaxID=1157616 RepID=A0A1Z5SNW9_HORWE|nr:hypothetical protein BTJ68_14690 [Hortaea werneckii EXF-2000]